MENYTFLLKEITESSYIFYKNNFWVDLKSNILFSTNFILEYFSNLLLILFIYSFVKLLILSSMFELLWPTHFFNSKHNIFKNKVKSRLFFEFFLKTYYKTPHLVAINITLYNWLIN